MWERGPAEALMPEVEHKIVQQVRAVRAAAGPVDAPGAGTPMCPRTTACKASVDGLVARDAVLVTLLTLNTVPRVVNSDPDDTM